MRGRLILLALVLLVVFLIGGTQAVGSALQWIAVSLAVTLLLGWLAIYLIKRKVRKETRRFAQMVFGPRAGPYVPPPGTYQPPPPSSVRDDSIDADFTVRK